MDAVSIIEVLRECEEYFDSRSDADHDGTGFVPNEEMKLLMSVREAINAASLISDAHELLEALKPFAGIGIGTNSEYEPMIRMDREAIIRARAAISKAEGE